MVIGRKQIVWILAVLAILVITAALGSVTHRKQTASVSQVAGDFQPVQPALESSAASDSANGNFFAEYRISRERLRSKQIEMLQSVMTQQAGDTKIRDAAGLRLVDITGAMEKELAAENLVKAEGYQECVVMFQPGHTTIVLQAFPLHEEQTKRIKTMVSQTVQCKQEQLSIITRGQP